MSKFARAKRPYFAVKNLDENGCIFIEKEVEFDWHKGMSWQVRQRSSLAMAQAIEEMYPDVNGKILEVSTKSHDHTLGSSLSAMNLMYTNMEAQQTRSVENWFQSSKQFSRQGEVFGPYLELLDLDGKSAKRFVNAHLDKKLAQQYAHNVLFNRIQAEIEGTTLCSFVFLGKNYATEPKSAFYDFLYANALNQNQVLANSLKAYSVFTDIEFNPKVNGQIVRYNTQARACAIFVALANKGLLDMALKEFDVFVDCVQYESAEEDELENYVQLEFPIF